MRKLIFLSIAILLLLASCTSTKEYQADISKQSTSDFLAIQTGGDPQAETSMPIITTENITQATTDTDLTVDAWAKNWVHEELNSDADNLELEKYDTIYTKNIIEGMSAGCTDFIVTYRKGDSNSYENIPDNLKDKVKRHVRVYWINDGQTQAFIKAEWTDDSLGYSVLSYEDLYYVIKADNRYNNKINPLKHLSADKGVFEYPVQRMTGDKINSLNILSDGIAAYITLEARDAEKSTFNLCLYDYKQNIEKFKINIRDEQGFPQLDIVDDKIIITTSFREGEKYVTRGRTIDMSGKIIKDEILDENNNKHYLSSGACILNENNGLYLFNEATGEKKLLLEGITIKDNEVQSEWLTFYAPVDESRFIYIIHGYEWIVRTGVFDISDFTDHVLSYEGKTSMHLLGYSRGRLYSTDGSFDAIMMANELLITDLSKGYTTYMPVKDIQELQKYVWGGPKISPDGSCVCVIMDNGFGKTVAVYNENGIIKSWNIETIKCTVQGILSFTDSKVVVYGSEVKDGEACLYEMEY